MSTETAKLTEQQEMLLMRFYDGECDETEEHKVRQLLCVNSEAATFLEGLQDLGENGRESMRAPELAPELWKRVANRIEQEERSAVFLGSRRRSGLSQRLLEPLRDSVRALGWRMYVPATALAAVFALFAVRLSSNPALMPAVGSLADNSQGAVVQVAAAGQSGTVQEGSYQPPILLEDREPVSLEVDWMKSRGPVKMFRDPAARSTFLIIDKKKRGVGRNSQEPLLRPEGSFDR